MFMHECRPAHQHEAGAPEVNSARVLPEWDEDDNDDDSD